MVITDDVLEAIKSETWVLDCPRIELIPAIEDDRVHHRGSGYIALRHGFFEFKLFSDPEPPPLFALLQSSADPSRFLADSHYYQLSATDISGRTWRASGIFPSFTKGVGIVASGKIDAIRYQRTLTTIRQNVLMLWYPEELKLPYNQVTNSVSKIGEKIVSASSTSNAAAFSSSGFNFSVKAGTGWTSISASREGDLPATLATRIQETMEFVLGPSLQATIAQEFSADGIITTTIMPSKLKVTNDAFPPLISQFSPDATTWKLLDCFFRYVEKSGSFLRSPLSIVLQYVFLLRESPLEAQGLALGVAVEGLLKNEYADLAKPTDVFLAELDTVKRGLKGFDLSSSTERRIRGALGAMEATNAKTRLLALSGSGVILYRQIEAWEKLRHSTAHAELQDNPNKLLALCQRTLTLLHCLIFNLIGYAGPFTDYGASEYPTREYPLADESPNEREDWDKKADL